MGTMRVLHPSQGDATLTWNPTDKMSVEEVKAVFDELVSNGMTGVETTTKGDVATREFNPLAESITVIPQLQGG